MTTMFVDALAINAIGLQRPQPSITQWQRLESDPVELDLVAGLEARLADPLWLIGRQWQFAELKGEDAGMPVVVELSGEEGRLGFDTTDGDSHALPEPAIEAEAALQAIPAIAVNAAVDLREALLDALPDEDGGKAFAAFRDAFPLTLAANPDDAVGRDFTALLGDQALDADALATALDGALDASGVLIDLPASINLSGSLRDTARQAAEAWLEDWHALLVEPHGESSWKPERLEYTTTMTAATSDGTVPIAVPEYASGRFDWWALDVGGPPQGPPAVVRTVEAKRIPMPIRFPGMAADRLFEIEPDGVNLLAANAGPTGFMTMLMIEYAVAASNDWYQMPLTLSYGSTFRVKTMNVRDSFGQVTQIPASASGGAHWAMFVATESRFASSRSPLFLYPAATAHAIQGEAIEEVAFFRDEMTNLAWAVERRLPGVTPTSFRPQPEPSLGQQLESPEAPDAGLIYRLQTPVPHNWFPLAPELADGTTVLRLRPLKRLGEPAGSGDKPTAEVLKRPDGKALIVEEREIPRTGIIVMRSFQFARDTSGRRLIWLGRQKLASRGEGSSKLRFDWLDPASV